MILDSIKLRKLREKNKFSQAELATHLDLSQTTICDWEKQDHDVKLEHILKLGEVLQCDISELTKDGTTINNQNNNKISSHAVVSVGSNIQIESYQLQKDFIDSLKKQVVFLENEIIRLKAGY